MPAVEQFRDHLEGTTPHGDIEWWENAIAEAQDEERRQTLERNRSFISSMARAFRNNYYVSCWNMAPTESGAMWGCYTKSVDSVAIMTSYECLRNFLPDYVYS